MIHVAKEFAKEGQNEYLGIAEKFRLPYWGKLSVIGFSQFLADISTLRLGSPWPICFP